MLNIYKSSTLTRKTQYFQGATGIHSMDSVFVLCREHLKEHFRTLSPQGFKIHQVSGRAKRMLGCDTCHGDGPYIPGYGTAVGKYSWSR